MIRIGETDGKAKYYFDQSDENLSPHTAVRLPLLPWSSTVTGQENGLGFYTLTTTESGLAPTSLRALASVLTGRSDYFTKLLKKSVFGDNDD